MYYKSLNILIQRRLSKFILINYFDLAGGLKGFFSGLGSPSKLFLSKLYVSITKRKEKLAWNHFHAGVG